MPALDAPGPCPQCGSGARIVSGLCSNCGVLRGEWPSSVPVSRARTPLFRLEDDWQLLVTLAGLALVGLGALGVLGPWAIVVGAALAVAFSWLRYVV